MAEYLLVRVFIDVASRLLDADELVIVLAFPHVGTVVVCGVNLSIHNTVGEELDGSPAHGNDAHELDATQLLRRNFLRNSHH